MKYTLIAAALLAPSLWAAEVPLFIVGGQSNTDGRLDNKAEDQKLPAYIAQGNDKALVSFGEGKFASFAPATGKKTQPRRWAYDAPLYYWLAQNLGTIYVAKTSYGGTSVDPTIVCSGEKKGALPPYKTGYHWSADPAFLAATRPAGEAFTVNGTNYVGQSLLLKWVNNMDCAIDAIKAKGDTPVVKAIVWHQGESDKKSHQDYAANLTAVVTYVRQHLAKKMGDDKLLALPFFCGTVPRKSALYSDRVDKAFLALDADRANNIYVADLHDGVMKIHDNKHFNATSAETLAKRLYNRMVDARVLTGDKLEVAPCTRSL